MTQGVPGEDEMTSRAGQALLDDPRLRRADIGRDALGEAVAAIEKEVRDDIRARLGNPYEWNPGYCPWCDKTMLTEGHASDCLFAVISSSSATETQDGLPDANRVGGYSAYGEPYAEDAYDGATETQDGQPDWETPEQTERRIARDSAWTPLRQAATETQDGERPGLAPEEAVDKALLYAFQLSNLDYAAIKNWRAPEAFIRALEQDGYTISATPTPDDRDRETAWLIERGQSMGQVPTVWYSGEDYGEQWTTDANRALRYPSKEAAEAEIDLRSGHPIPSHGGPEGSRFGVAVEHGWIVTPTPDDRDRERKDSMTKRPVLRLTGAQLASIDPPVSEEWFIDADEYEDFVVAPTPDDRDRPRSVDDIPHLDVSEEEARVMLDALDSTPDDRDREVECVSCDDDHDANIHDHHWHDLDKTTYIGMEHGRELTDSEDAAENATWD